MDSPLEDNVDNIPQHEARFAEELGRAAFEDPEKDPRMHYKLSPVFFPGKGQSRPILRIRPLQHMTIVHLQRLIGKKVARIYENKTASHRQMEEIRKLLRAYTQALQDWKFMLEEPSEIPEVATFIKNQLEIVPKKRGKKPPASDTSAAVLIGAGLSRGKVPIMHVSDYYGVGGRTHRELTQVDRIRKLLQRISMALFGGVSMIAPMLIMTLHSDIKTSLGTTSAFVIVAGIILAIFMKDAAPKDIFAATAAYAAVLVVFVGTIQAAQLSMPIN